MNTTIRSWMFCFCFVLFLFCFIFFFLSFRLRVDVQFLIIWCNSLVSHCNISLDGIHVPGAYSLSVYLKWCWIVGTRSHCLHTIRQFECQSKRKRQRVSKNVIIVVVVYQRALQLFRISAEHNRILRFSNEIFIMKTLISLRFIHFVFNTQLNVCWVFFLAL